jgi:SpoVK/Ycf46/Vps4 family AAA+-type ATPase
MSEDRITILIPASSSRRSLKKDGPHLKELTLEKKRKRTEPDEKISPNKKWKLTPRLEPPFKLDTIDDLLHIAWNYRGDQVNWFTLWKLIPSLTELKSLVGLEKAKQSIIDMVVYHVQGFHKNQDGSKGDDMLHTVFYGCPGVGKTTLAHILAKIYCNMGLLPTDTVITAKRTDFVKMWTGHSEAATLELLKSALGGVLFIDEAYSMGSENKTDSFSKAAVDMINQFLSEHNKDFICIIAGYEEDLEKCFFAINKGLKRRFSQKFYIDGYSSKELLEMFEIKVTKEGWKLGDKSIDENFFTTNKDHFGNYGGDIQNFFTACKTSHCRRIFGLTTGGRTFTTEDIKKGAEKFIKEKNKVDVSMQMMFS